MPKRKTIGQSPLDTVIPEQPSQESQQPADGRQETRDKVEKERMTVHLPIDLIDRAKNAVYWTPGLTLAGLAETALRHIVDQLEEERGEPFPEREGELKGGRPLK